jgi:hypothetical protein
MSKGENKLIRKRLANAYLSSIISISLILLLVGVASLLLVNTESVSNYFKENMKVSVLIKPDVEDAKAADFEKSIVGMPFVKGTEFISREQGEEEMKRMLGEDFLSVFETSPVPVSIDVTLKAEYVADDSLKVVRALISSNPIVDEVVYHKSLVDTLNDNLRKISLVLAVFIALLLFISFVLINNVIRLSFYDKRFTIHTMKLVGATRGFIRGPFLLRSAFLGIFSAIIAILMLVGLLYFVRSEFVQLFELFKLDMLLTVMGIVVASGLLICLLSTYFVVNKLISMRKDDLYY